MHDMKELRRRAEQGEATARFELGHAYHYGTTPLGQAIGNDGISVDWELAFKWYRLAADQGLPDAQFYLGLMYADGDGVAKDNEEAFKWFHKAAIRGDSVAQGNVGQAYQVGLGVTVDHQEAVRWLQMAADQDYWKAQTGLGVAYAEGLGVEVDFKEAVKRFHIAAKARCAIAQYNLGVAYFNGHGVARDDEEAAKWFSMSAEQGHTEAQSMLEHINEDKDRDAAGGTKTIRWDTIDWQLTLLLHFYRSLATGVVYMLLSMVIIGESFSEGLFMVATMPIPFFLFVLPVSLLCIRFDTNGGPIVKYMGFIASLGDPLLWFFNRVTRARFLPVRKFIVFSSSLVLYVAK